MNQFTYKSATLKSSDQTVRGNPLFLTSTKAGEVKFLVHDSSDRIADAVVSVVVGPGPAAVIVANKGDNQAGVVATTLAQPLEVLVTDAFGNPVPGEDLTFTVTPPVSGTASTVTLVNTSTGSNGLGSSSLTLGTLASAVSTGVSLPNVPAVTPVTFTAQAQPGTPAYLTLSGTTEVPELTCSRGLYQVEIVDQYLNETPATSPVTFTLSNGTGHFIDWFSDANCTAGNEVAAFLISTGVSRTSSFHGKFGAAGTQAVGLTGALPLLATPTFTANPRSITTYQSYQMAIDTVVPRGLIAGDTGAATFDFYYSNDAALVPDQLPTSYSASAHHDGFNEVTNFWAGYTPGGLGDYGYFGKSTAGRGADSFETGAPTPTGASVFDFQMHPADPYATYLRSMARFKSPHDGTYRVHHFGAHRPTMVLMATGQRLSFSIDRKL